MVNHLNVVYVEYTSELLLLFAWNHSEEKETRNSLQSIGQINAPARNQPLSLPSSPP